MKSFETGNTSLKCKRDFIDRMIFLNKISEACQVATQLANHFPEAEKIKFKGLYHNLLNKLHPSKRTKFLLTLNPAFRKILKDEKVSNANKMSRFGSQKDLDILEAFRSDDMTKVLTILATGEPTAGSVNKIFHKLLKEDRLEEAAEVAQLFAKTVSLTSSTSTLRTTSTLC